MKILLNNSKIICLVVALLSACTSSEDGKKPRDPMVENSPDQAVAASVVKSNFLQIDRFILTEVPWREDSVTDKSKSGGKTIAQLFATGQFEKVETKARNILRREPYEPRAIVLLIQSLLMQRKFALAQIYANLNQRKLLANADFLNARGVSAYVVYRGQPQGVKLAQDAFLSALKVDAKHAAARVNYGNLLLLTSRDKDARETFVKLKQDCRQCYVAVLGLAMAATRLGKFTEAIDNWQIALQKNPKDYAARYYLVETYLYGVKDKEKAQAELKTLLQVLPKEETNWLAKARDLQQTLGGTRPQSEDEA